MSDEKKEFDRDDQGVALQGMLTRTRKMIESAEGATLDAQLANWLSFVIAAADLGPERSRAACEQALKAHGRIQELLGRAGTTPRH